MKRIAVGCLLLITLWGCDKGSLVGPIVDPPKVYTATLIIKGVGEEKTEVTSGLKAGDVKSFKTVQYQGYSRVSVIINGVAQSLPLSDVYDVKIISSDVKIEFEYLENRVISLTQVPLYLQKSEQQETQTGTGIWVTMIPDPIAFTFKYVYKVDGTYYMYDKSGAVIGGGKWHLTEKGLVIEKGTEYTSITFNPDGTVVVTYTISGFGLTFKMRDTFGPAQKPS